MCRVDTRRGEAFDSTSVIRPRELLSNSTKLLELSYASDVFLRRPDTTRYTVGQNYLYVIFDGIVPGKRGETFVVIKLRFFLAEVEKATRGTKKNGQGESEKSNRADRSSVSSQQHRASSKLTMTHGVRVSPRLTFFPLDPVISPICSNRMVQ